MYGDIGVTLTSVDRTVDFVVRSFELRKSDSVRHVKQFHYTTWPDHGVPIRASPIVAFRRRVRSYDESYPGIIIVHCRFAAPSCIPTYLHTSSCYLYLSELLFLCVIQSHCPDATPVCLAGPGWREITAVSVCVCVCVCVCVLGSSFQQQLVLAHKIYKKC